MWRCRRRIEGEEEDEGGLGVVYMLTIDVSMRRRGDENMGCKMLKVGLYVYILAITNHSVNENDQVTKPQNAMTGTRTTSHFL